MASPPVRAPSAAPVVCYEFLPSSRRRRRRRRRRRSSSSLEGHRWKQMAFSKAPLFFLLLLSLCVLQ